MKLSELQLIDVATAWEMTVNDFPLATGLSINFRHISCFLNHLLNITNRDANDAVGGIEASEQRIEAKHAKWRGEKP